MNQANGVNKIAATAASETAASGEDKFVPVVSQVESPQKTAGGKDGIVEVASAVEPSEDEEDESARNFFSRFCSPEAVCVRQANGEIAHVN